jgi:hypothetical protein
LGVEKTRLLLVYEFMEKKVQTKEEEISGFDVRMLLDELENDVHWKIRLHIAQWCRRVKVSSLVKYSA